MSNAERQARWREKRDAKIKAQIEELKVQLKGVAPAAPAAEVERLKSLDAAHRLKIAGLEAEIAKLRKSAGKSSVAETRKANAELRQSADEFLRDENAKLKVKVKNLEHERYAGWRRAKGDFPLTPEQFKQIRNALHPDMNNEAKRNAAFVLFNGKESKLAPPPPPPKPDDWVEPPPPPSMEEMMANRARYDAENRERAKKAAETRRANKAAKADQ
jgi:hypothetical protein